MKTNLPSVYIEEILFSGGQELKFDPDEKVLIVGPNNSGKSNCLREILGTITCNPGAHPFNENATIKNLNLYKSGDSNELRQFLEQKSKKLNNSYVYQNINISVNQVNWYDLDFMGPIGNLFCKNIGAEDRLKITETQLGVAPGKPRIQPQHLMYDSGSLMNRISELFKQAFGESLFFDFRATPEIPIHIGQPPNPEHGEDRVSDAYVEKVRQQPNLVEQGDGMRSYAGLLFQAIAVEHKITLIDEPEAFLHPPQMRRLGETLANETIGQLFVATHSADILKGFLEGTKGNLRIIRLQRMGDENLAKETSAEKVRELWEKPELKYSNALDGIFHERSILCEDDSDCRFYNSIFDHIEKRKSKNKSPDTAFIPCGGKHGMPKIATALTQIGVPVKVIVDIDFLNDNILVENMIKSLGGDWTEFSSDWTELDAAIRSGVKPFSKKEILSKIVAEFDEAENGKIPNTKISDLMKQNQPWGIVKKMGKMGIPNGNAQKIYERLDKRLQNLGISVVSVGEIENFCPEIGLHGPKFVSKLLKSVKLGSSKLSKARKFVRQVCK
jgi:ABC-type transporter Mla maintaining outer membrane lipid asymmetry ATPase subunit MlaF